MINRISRVLVVATISKKLKVALLFSMPPSRVKNKFMVLEQSYSLFLRFELRIVPWRGFYKMFASSYYKNVCWVVCFESTLGEIKKATTTSVSNGSSALGSWPLSHLKWVSQLKRNSKAKEGNFSMSEYFKSVFYKTGRVLRCVIVLKEKKTKQCDTLMLKVLSY